MTKISDFSTVCDRETSFGTRGSQVQIPPPPSALTPGQIQVVLMGDDLVPTGFRGSGFSLQSKYPRSIISWRAKSLVDFLDAEPYPPPYPPSRPQGRKPRSLAAPPPVDSATAPGPGKTRPDPPLHPYPWPTPPPPPLRYPPLPPNPPTPPKFIFKSGAPLVSPQLPDRGLPRLQNSASLRCAPRVAAIAPRSCQPTPMGS